MTQQIQNYHFDKKHARLVDRLVKHFARSQPKSIRKILPTNERLLEINLHRLSRRSNKTRFYVLEPSNPESLISLATTDKSKVAEFARLGVSDMDTFLHKSLELSAE